MCVCVCVCFCCVVSISSYSHFLISPVGINKGLSCTNIHWCRSDTNCIRYWPRGCLMSFWFNPSLLWYLCESVIGCRCDCPTEPMIELLLVVRGSWLVHASKLQYKDRLLSVPGESPLSTFAASVRFLCQIFWIKALNMAAKTLLLLVWRDLNSRHDNENETRSHSYLRNRVVIAG